LRRCPGREAVVARAPLDALYKRNLSVEESINGNATRRPRALCESRHGLSWGESSIIVVLED
jgi:hypothetical protein